MFPTNILRISNPKLTRQYAAFAWQLRQKNKYRLDPAKNWNVAIQRYVQFCLLSKHSSTSIRLGSIVRQKIRAPDVWMSWNRWLRINALCLLWLIYRNKMNRLGTAKKSLTSIKYRKYNRIESESLPKRYKNELHIPLHKWIHVIPVNNIKSLLQLNILILKCARLYVCYLCSFFEFIRLQSIWIIPGRWLQQLRTWYSPSAFFFVAAATAARRKICFFPGIASDILSHCLHYKNWSFIKMNNHQRVKKQIRRPFSWFNENSHDKRMNPQLLCMWSLVDLIKFQIINV